jgi:hypothetical protein
MQFDNANELAVKLVNVSLLVPFSHQLLLASKWVAGVTDAIAIVQLGYVQLSVQVLQGLAALQQLNVCNQPS